MATLAPNVPTQGDPEYLRYSKPISSVEGNKAGYYLAKGLGDTLEQGVSSTEKIVGDYVSNKTYEQLNSAAEREGQRLDVAEANLLGTNANTDVQPRFAETVDSKGSLVPDNSQETPPPVQNGIKTIASLKERYTNGKISETDYLADRAKILKDLNAQYPGFRKYITDGAARATGEGSADALIRARISDYNSIMSKLNENKNRVDTEYFNALKQIPDDQTRAIANHRRFGLQPGQPGYMDDEEARYNAATWEAHNLNRQKYERELSISEKEGNADKRTAQQQVNQTIAETISGWRHNLQVRNGVGSWDQLMDKVRVAQANPDSMEGQQIANDVASSINQLKVELQKNTAYGRKILGGDLDKSLQEASSFFDTMAKEAVGGDISKLGNIVSSAGNAVAAMEQNAKLGWVKIPGFGDALLKYNALGSLAPEVQKTYLDTFQSVVKNAGKTIGDHFQDTMTKGMAVSPEDKKNRPININQRIDEAHAMGATPPTIKNYIDFVSNIKDMPKDKARNLAYMYYGTENLGMLGKWAKDDYDPRTGTLSEGKNAILQKMGDKQTLDKIWSIGDPKLNNQVQSFLENGFAKHVFPSLMNDLEGTAKFGLAYDDKANEFVIRRPQEQMRDYGPLSFAQGRSNYAQATQTVKQLNYAIGVVRNLAEHLGKDPNAYLVELIASGNPNVGQVLNTESTPQQTESAVVRALSNQVLAKKMKKESGK